MRGNYDKHYIFRQFSGIIRIRKEWELKGKWLVRVCGHIHGGNGGIVMVDMLRDMIDGILGLQDDLESIMEFVKDLPFVDLISAGKTPLATTVEGIATVFQASAMTLLVFFFFYEFLKKTIMLEFVSWENVLKVLLRFLIAKAVVQSAYVIFEGIAIVVNGIIDTMQAPGALDQMLGSDTATDVVDAYNSQGFMAKPFFFIKYALAWLVMMIVRIFIVLVIYGRFLEIGIYAAISPLPLATLAGESTSEIGKKFVLGYIAVLLQGIIIIIMCSLYVGIVNSYMQKTTTWVGFFGGNIISYILLSLILLFTLFKSGNWAKQIMGA